METSHITAGARESERLVKDDRDRIELLRRLVGSVGAALVLAYCILDTHIHLVLEGPAALACERARPGLVAYTRWFNARHGRRGTLLRGPVEAMTARTSRELARQIAYVHENPVRTKTPIVAEEIFFEWSSARAFAGLSRAPVPNVARALALVGEDRRWVVRRGPPLSELEPAHFPSVGAELVLSAAAQTFGTTVGDLLADGRAPETVAARAVYVALGRLEGFSDGHLAAPFGRTRRRVSQIGSGPVDLVAVRIARTLLRHPALRARLSPGRTVQAPLHV